MLKSGVNVGAWRLRASNSLTANSDDKPQWTTSGAWLERDLTRWQSELTLGDTFTSGDVFDAVQFQGISLASSDAMLPDSQKVLPRPSAGLPEPTPRSRFGKMATCCIKPTSPPARS